MQEMKLKDREQERDVTRFPTGNESPYRQQTRDTYDRDFYVAMIAVDALIAAGLVATKYFGE